MGMDARGVGGGIYDSEYDAFGMWPPPKIIPKSTMDAADAAGAAVVASLMEGRRRFVVEVEEAQLQTKSMHFSHEAMAEFIELLLLPLVAALESLNPEQNRCKVVFHNMEHLTEAKKAIMIDDPDTIAMDALEHTSVDPKDRVVVRAKSPMQQPLPLCSTSFLVAFNPSWESVVTSFCVCVCVCVCLSCSLFFPFDL
ncbi:unnamed protein product [Choristocarpus tenellus]